MWALELARKVPAEIVLLEIFFGRNRDNLKEYFALHSKLYFREATKIQVFKLIYSHDINCY
jgi:hypothetical protein|tara:strand:- start:26502 stop:26684 length:183 start_codon:yes stop_codon:yes gene_type:complete